VLTTIHEEIQILSLIGIDVGSSSVKIGVYDSSGRIIAIGRENLTPVHPHPGWWEQDPNQVWNVTYNLIGQQCHKEAVKRDPPQAIAVCASVRENFPADNEGNPLAPCIMAADLRGENFEVAPAELDQPEEWAFSCGHMRERMDPFNRLLWWHENNPSVIGEATFFPGWHEFLSLRMCGRYTTDPAIASRWRVFDINSQDWAKDGFNEFSIDPKFLPEVLPWGTIIGEVRKELLDDWGIPSPLILAVGTSDLNGAALGAGVSSVGEICMASGSFENLLIATSELPSANLLLHGLSVTPHPGPASRAIWAISPTGTAVLNWARDLLGISIEELDQQLQTVTPAPSTVLAIPYLSGALSYWPNGRKLRGSIHNLTLASSPLDIISAFMESIAYDHVNTFSLLREEGVAIDTIRAMGGGSKSVWWTQLKADMMNIPIDVIDQQEAGTLGGSLLAGFAQGSIQDLTEASRNYSGITRRYVPNPARAKLHQKKLDTYQTAVEHTLGMD
jgi:xylulokinase